jgi:methyl-accepting chemotaxis protein
MVLSAQMGDLITDLIGTTRTLLATQSSTAVAQFALLGLVVVLLAGAATVKLARTITRRLERLSRAAAEMEAGNLSDEDIESLRESKGSDEIASLMRLFARTAVGVKSRETALRQEVQNLHIEIDHTKAAQEVAEIAETDYFKQLQAKAKGMRGSRDQIGS